MRLSNKRSPYLFGVATANRTKVTTPNKYGAEIIACMSDWENIFRTLSSIPFLPDKSRSSDIHIVRTFRDVVQTFQAPGLAAEVDPIAHFGHFRSHLATCTWNKLENSCRRSMSLYNRFDFGTSKHPSMFYLSCDAIFDCQNIAGSASGRRHLGSESGTDFG